MLKYMNGILSGQVRLIDELTSLVIGILLIISFSFLLIYFSYSPVPKSNFSSFDPSQKIKITEKKAHEIKANIKGTQRLPVYEI